MSELTVMDWFAGAGGSSQGADAVPGVRVERAANHWEQAIATHAANFPGVDHYRGDIREAPVERWPVADVFWASPECPAWSTARGRRQDFVASRQGALFGPEPDEEVERSRALMEEVPMYLRGVQERGGLVKAGVVENVVDVRAWDQWDRWLGEIHKLGYRTRLIALNSMHAAPRTTPRCPQSRDRLYLAYWHTSLGRTLDWDKWLRPRAWCESCDAWVSALQSWKMPGRDMGRYKSQYVYRCPTVSCRGAIVEPETLPAAAAIDWTIEGQCIGDRLRPLAEKTVARIRAGLERYAGPLMVPAGGTWREDGLAVPAAMVVRNNSSRSGPGGGLCTPATEPIRTLTTAGHQSLVTWDHLLIPYYGTGTARPVSEPVGALTTRDRYALVSTPTPPAIDDVRFRMLAPHEVGRAMSFADGYTVLGTKRQKVRQYGNAVTPNVAEVLISALSEAITGDDLDRYASPETEAAV